MITRRMYIFASLLLAIGCSKNEQPGNEPMSDGQTILVLNAGMNGLGMSVETRATSGNWIQEKIGMTNIAIAIFDHDSGEKVYSGAKYPFKLVDPTQAYQTAWLLGNFAPDQNKTYDLAFACNFPKAAELNAFLNAGSWEDLTEHEPQNPSFQMSRTDMSSPTTVANAAGENENQPAVAGYAKDGGKMYVNQWRSPILSGYIRGIKLTAGGINALGFQNSPTVDPAVINSDLGTSFTESTLPTILDASYGETDNARRILAIGPCYAMLVVDGITNNTSGKLEITDIFMMNVPMYHHIFAETTYHFGSSPELFKNTIGTVAYSSGKDLVSGFKPSWINDEFKARTASDDFARLLHYPADGKVPQTDFIAQYGTSDENANSKYFFKLAQTGQMLDRLCVTKGDANDDFSGRLSGNWAWLQTNFPLAYDTKTVRKSPFFILSENLGDYPNEETVDEKGDRQYLFATRLVIRGKWTENGVSEIVYYPIVVNGPSQGFTSEFAPDSQETESNFVRKGHRYIYNITIQSKGVPNPWTASRVAVSLGSLELKVDNWVYYDVELPKYIY